MLDRIDVDLEDSVHRAYNKSKDIFGEDSAIVQRLAKIVSSLKGEQEVNPSLDWLNNLWNRS